MLTREGLGDIFLLSNLCIPSVCEEIENSIPMQTALVVEKTTDWKNTCI